MAAMADLQAFVITLLTWAAVSVSGTTLELSTITGDTINIPCLYGEGTLHYIRWYYDYNSGRQNILVFTEGDFLIEPKYENRAILHDDKSTLILKEITVADEGTYHCVVDTRKHAAALNIKTKLNVFNLRPDTLPVITPNCTWVDDPSSCSIHANQPFTLTCTLPNVYPVKDTELIWYKDRKHFSSIHDIMQNDDETTDIIRQIKIYETGIFTCNATYNSATGKENTAVAVEAWIIPTTDVPNTPGKNMTSIPIAWKTMSIVLLAGISMAIIARFLYFLKARGQRSSRKDRNKSDDTEIYQEDTDLRSISIENGSKDENAESSNPTKIPTAERSQNIEEESTLLGASYQNDCQDDNEERRSPLASAGNSSKDGIVTLTEERRPPLASAGKSSKDGIADSLASTQSFTSELRSRRPEESREQDFDDILKAIAKSIHNENEIDDLGKELGFNPTEMQRYLATNTKYGAVTYMGTLSMLRHWRNKTKRSEESEKLKIALIRINQHRLANLLKDDMAS